MVTKTEFYRFVEQGVDDPWLFTSGDDEVEYLDETYDPVSISRTEAQLKTDLARADIDVSMSLNNPLAIRCLETNGERQLTLVIYERSKTGIISVIWKGRLRGIIPGMINVELKMESLFTSLRRLGLRAKYQRNCRHPLYGRGCYVDPEVFAVIGNVSAVTDRTLTIVEADALADGWFVGGMLRTPDNLLAYVTNHVGNQVTVQRMSRSLYDAIQDGLPFEVTLYPGCDHTIATCDSKFNNKLNCGCFNHFPKKNPMGGSSIV